MLNVVGLHLVENLQGVGQSLGNVGEDVVHLLPSLKPLLLGVKHTRGVVEVFSRGKAEQVVVCLGVLLVDKVGVVCANHLYAVFLCQFQYHLVCPLLQGVCLAVSPYAWVFHLVTLYFKVVVIAEEVVIPFHRLACSLDVVFQNLLWHLATYAS